MARSAARTQPCAEANKEAGDRKAQTARLKLERQAATRKSK
jgi:hypothetical protein